MAKRTWAPRPLRPRWPARLTNNLTSHLRLQFSRDLQQSYPNSAFPLTRIYDAIDGFGRSSILPRTTREHRLHAAETLALSGRRHSFKFGGDFIGTWIYNFFPSLFGGEYIFDDVTVDPWTFAPQTYGMRITPLRAYAHMVPHYYIQNFGTAVSHPDTTEYAAFVQDTIRVTDHFGLTLGVRYDFQAFRTDKLVSNYYFRPIPAACRWTATTSPRGWGSPTPSASGVRW